MGRYSYSQPSQESSLFGNNDDSDYSETEDLIRRDQTKLSLERSSQVHYPPQPEVEFGFPQNCQEENGNVKLECLAIDKQFVVEEENNIKLELMTSKPIIPGILGQRN
ncbi:hypothetical protein Bca52824_010868 [Brassica carinata]|uniref:Uncharacterized protein n=1 Tax=Brassica carinata TaxID=52824 RepID=A0A8X7WFY6_BRACI|nr:hypothetical protein Bca52824_010868 [Brassica carinata]